MDPADFVRAAQSLSVVLELPEDGGDVHLWRPDDLRDMWQHQLAAPLVLSLGHLSPEVAHRISAEGRDPLLRLAEVLQDSRPPVGILQLLRRFAKSCRADPGIPLPREFVMLLYYASIAAALVRCHERISNLSNDSIRRGLRWYRKQPWLDEATRALLRDGERRLKQVEASERATGDGRASDEG
jgi:hypothetical protein